MRECYNLNEKYSYDELADIADIFYQRTKRIGEFLQTTTDEIKREKAKRLFIRLTAITFKMVSVFSELSKPKPTKDFEPAGIEHLKR